VLLVLFCLSVSAGLIVTYLQLHRELDVISNRLVAGEELSSNFLYMLYHTVQAALVFLTVLG